MFQRTVVVQSKHATWDQGTTHEQHMLCTHYDTLYFTKQTLQRRRAHCCFRLQQNSTDISRQCPRTFHT